MSECVNSLYKICDWQEVACFAIKNLNLYSNYSLPCSPESYSNNSNTYQITI